MSLESEIEEKVRQEFKEAILEVKIPREHRMFITVPLIQVKKVISYLKQNFALTHITTITAIDAEENIEVIYHFFTKGVELSLKTSVPKANPVIDTITPIIPGAILYEREIQDLLGLKVKEHPDPRRLVLPEDWPEGVYPLRKDYKVLPEGQKENVSINSN
jgi:Ni,Fe-hydrogenase III component G